MARLRSVDTHFWDDDYIIDLDPIEKLLFLYLLTNSATGMSGCYERHIKKISFETGVERDASLKILARFEASGKMIYREGWVILFNFNKHNNLNPSMQRAAEKELDAAPPWVKTVLQEHQRQDASRMQAACDYPADNRIELNGTEGKERLLLQIFNEVFPDFTPSPFQQGLIFASVDDVEQWQLDVKYWAGNGYQPRSIDKLLDMHFNNMKDKQNPKLSATPVVVEDGCPFCTSVPPRPCPIHKKEVA